jgi:hypothetical protein
LIRHPPIIAPIAAQRQALLTDDIGEPAGLDIAVADARMTSIASGGTWSEMSRNGTPQKRHPMLQYGSNFLNQERTS